MIELVYLPAAADFLPPMKIAYYYCYCIESKAFIKRMNSVVSQITRVLSVLKRMSLITDCLYSLIVFSFHSQLQLNLSKRILDLLTLISVLVQ